MIKQRRELKNVGIKPIEELSVQEKTYIAEKIATKLESLNVSGITHSEILEQLFCAKMYTAQMNQNLGKVRYHSKSKTIYFDKDISLLKIDENILRECIHYLQDKTEKREKLKRMGLCTQEQYKIRGNALNEVGIDYISNKLLEKNKNSKTFILLNQMLLITGEEIFLDSILNNNSKFEEKFIEQTNSEVLFSKIQTTFDVMFDLEKIIKRLNIEGRQSTKPEKYLRKINMHKHTLSLKFSEIQWEIYNRYFSRKIELLDQIQEIKDCKNEMFNYNQLLEINEDEIKYTNFITEKFERLDNIELQIRKEKANNQLMLVGNRKFLRTIKKLISTAKGYKETKE